MASSTLQTIRDKVRRITRSPSTSQLTDAQINEYINTFVLYDFPEQLRTFALRTTLTFYTQPNVSRYETNTTTPTDPLYNFKNRYVAIHPPVFIAGVQGFYTQRRDVFYGNYPQTVTITDTALRGTGGIGPFTGTLSARPVLQNNVVFTCLDANGTAMVLKDQPFGNVLGELYVADDPTFPSPYGSINYITGAYTLNFPNNTLLGAIIYSETIPYQAAKPMSVLFYDNVFTILPVPDKVYPVQIEVDARPTELLVDNQSPELEQWWQFLSLGSAIKVFQDRLDMESIQLIMPEYQNQENLCIRSTLTTAANERTVTIFTVGKNYGNGGWFNSNWPY